MTNDELIAVICGGKSNEREVSISSGAAVKEALMRNGHTVIVLDPADTNFITNLVSNSPSAVFLALHGIGGEDGTIQGLCELLEIPYTGSSVLSSAMAMDKVISKQMYESAGISTPEYLVISKGDKYCVDELFNKFDGKLVAKAISEGSARNVHLCNSRMEFESALAELFESHERILLERCIEGKEITCGVIDANGETVSLPVIEIVSENDFYDYDAKYQPGQAQHLCPAPIDSDLEILCRSIAQDAHRALQCYGVSRTDMIIDDNNKPWVLETNTLPGMTSTSLLPDAAAEAGIPFDELCEVLLSSASLKMGA